MQPQRRRDWHGTAAASKLEASKRAENQRYLLLGGIRSSLRRLAVALSRCRADFRGFADKGSPAAGQSERARAQPVRAVFEDIPFAARPTSPMGNVRLRRITLPDHRRRSPVQSYDEGGRREGNDDNSMFLLRVVPLLYARFRAHLGMPIAQPGDSSRATDHPLRGEGRKVYPCAGELFNLFRRLREVYRINRGFSAS